MFSQLTNREEMMIKDKKSLKVSKSPSRRKFFAKAVVATGAVVAGGFLAGCEPAKKKSSSCKTRSCYFKNASSLAFRSKHLF